MNDGRTGHYSPPHNGNIEEMTTIVIVGLLVIAGIWAVYLLPVVFGERNTTPLSSTDEFDRWTHSMANVQRHTVAELAQSSRELVRARRRRTLITLGVLAIGSLGAAWRMGSMPWLLIGLFFVSLVFLYVSLLVQMKQRRDERLKVTHVAERTPEWDETPIKVIAN